MRCAFAEAIIAQELCRTIFIELYASASGGHIDELTRTLSWLAESHPFEAVITRCQLARALGESSSVEKLPNQAAERVCATLRPWLGNNQRRQFAEDLAGQFTIAIDLWKPLQRTAGILRVENDLTDDY
jgi:hypothetical protein